MKHTLFIGLLFTSLFFTNCSDDNEISGASTKNTPEFNILNLNQNASGYWSINVKNLIDESGLENLDLGMMGSVVKSYTRYLTDTASGGIDFSESVKMANYHNSDYESNYSLAVLKVVNREKVRKLLKDNLPGYAAKNYEETEAYFSYSQPSFAGVWDDENFVIAHSENESDTLIQIAIRALTSKGLDAPANPQLTNLIANADDVCYFLNLEKSVLMSQNTNSDVEINQEMLDAFKGAEMMGHLNFTDGEIKYSADVVAENLKNSKYNVFNADGLSKDLLEAVTTKHSLNVGGANLKLENLFNIMKGVEGGEFTSMLERYEISESDLLEALTGQLSFSMVDLIPETKVVTEDDFFDDESAFDLDPELIIGLQLANTEAFETIMNKFAPKVNGVWKIEDMYVAINDNVALFSQNINGVKSASADNGSLPIDSTDLKSPIFGKLNTDQSSYSEVIKAKMNEFLSDESIDKIWMAEKVSVSGNFNHFEVTVKMRDSSKNALGILFENVATVGMNLMAGGK